MSGLRGFTLDPADLSYVGHGLSRPECIIAERDGTLWISDDRGAVIRLDPDGRQTLVGDMRGAPNGVAMGRDGSLYIANIEHGRLYRQHRDGRHEVVLGELDGAPPGAINFVCTDSRDRLWITVSTRAVPRSEAIAKPRPDGYVVLLDDGVARIVLDGLMFTNEVRLDADEAWLYVAETTAARITRAPIRADGSLGPRETFGPDPIGEGLLIDGITFDAEGNLWVTEITRNGLIALAPDGTPHTVIEDPAGTHLNFPTSLTFGGPDLLTAYVGSLKATRLAAFRAPAPGLPLAHWACS